MPIQTDEQSVPEADGDEPTVTAHQSCTDRTVFTERGNKDGWIATDLTVERWR